MIISISGSPGVGKSAVARQLARQTKTTAISITSLVKSGKIPYTLDRTRKTKIISVKDTQRAIDKIIKINRGTVRNSIFIVEGHIAHLLRADVIFVLRCSPTLLRRRLASRRWPKRKIKENVEAETLDIITAEALCKAHKTKHKTKIYEIDTSGKSVEATVRTIRRILASKTATEKFKPGKIKWLTPKVI